jgi:hypothetical protein
VGVTGDAFLKVVGTVGTGPHHAGLRGQIKHMAQRSAVRRGLCRLPDRRPESLGTGTRPAAAARWPALG